MKYIRESLFRRILQFRLKTFQEKERPILILSLGGSGSTWVGRVVSKANNALYLEEPVSSAYKKENPKGRKLLKIDNDNYSQYGVDIKHSIYRGIILNKSGSYRAKLGEYYA